LTLLCVPLLHPSAIARGQWQKEPLQKVYLRRIKQGDWPDLNFNEPPPDSLLFPSKGDLEPFGKLLREWGWVSLDIEAAGKIMLCAGMTAMRISEDFEEVEIGPSLCLRFRTQYGGEYWSRSDLPYVVEWFDDLLADPSVGTVFHNGVGFDIKELRDYGFTFNGEIMDTFVLAHAIYSELQRGLQFCCTYLNGVPVWKAMIDEPEVEGKG
jgi:hypothetical protein